MLTPEYYFWQDENAGEAALKLGTFQINKKYCICVKLAVIVNLTTSKTVQTYVVL